MRQIKPVRRQPVELAVLTEIAPPPRYPALRSSPESLERANTSQLQYDPENANDTQLLSRSPKPASERGNNGLLPSPQAEGRQPKRADAAGNNGSANQLPNPSAPPAITSMSINRAPQPEAPPVINTPALQPATSPPAPSPKPSPGLPSSDSQDAAHTGTQRGDSNESTAFGLQQVQGQYMARVRAKVSKVNEANMPRDWIETVLTGKVYATFGLTIRRDGRIQSLQLSRSSGYSLLDGRAREAIYIASPFEGYPQNAGDTITLTVTVYYTPSR